MSILDFSTTAASNGTADATINAAEHQPPSTVNDGVRALMARLAWFRNWLAGNVTQGGTGNAYTITSGESLAAYTNGLRLAWKPNASASGVVTLNVDSIGAKKVYRPDGTQATTGDIISGNVLDVIYQSALDTAAGGFQIVGPSRSASTTLYVSATDKIIGRSTAGAGASEEITCTAAGRALIDDADAAAQRTTLGLGTAALVADSGLVHTTGTETVAGPKTFTSQQTLSVAGIPEVLDNTGGGSQVALLRQSGTKRSSLGADGTNALYVFGSSDATLVTVAQTGDVAAAGSVYSSTDNTKPSGAASNRWSVVYAGTGTINTSDAREKTPVRQLSPAERSAIRRVMAGAGMFQWLASVADKGANAARLHAGVTAQAVDAAFTSEGLDAARFGLFCADAIEEMYEIAPGRTIPAAEAVLDEEGAEISPAKAEEFIPPEMGRRPVIDPATGRQLVRLGVRYDQLMMMALAVLFQGEP